MFGPTKYLALAILAISAIGAFTGWRWLEVREARAADKVRFEQVVASLTAQLERIAKDAELSREASRDYQTQLLAVQSDADVLRRSNSGLRLVAYRSLQPFPAAPARLNDATPIHESDSGTAIDLVRLERLATNCQADAEQLAAFQGWHEAIN